MSTDDAAPWTTDPGDTLLFANDRVRVWSFTLEAGAESDFHQHLHDHVIIWPHPGTVSAQNPGDESWTIRQVAEAGFVAFKTVGSSGPLAPHRVRNEEDRALTHYVVELVDGASPSDVELPADTNDRGSVTFSATGEQY